MLKFNERFTRIEKIEILQKMILVNSYLYYELGESVISDYRYDSESKQLHDFKKRFPEEFAKARYGYAMKDFDGNTGWGFFENLNEKDKYSVELHAEMLLRFPGGNGSES